MSARRRRRDLHGETKMTDHHWTKLSGGDFNTGTNWSGAPGAEFSAGPRLDLPLAASPSASAAPADDPAHKGAVASGANGGVILASAAQSQAARPAILNSGTIYIPDHTYLKISGVVDNSGAIVLEGSHYGASLIVEGSATLTGGGQVYLQKNLHPNNFIYGATASTTLTNVDNTISGAGEIGATSSGVASLVLVNDAKGVINGSAGPDNGENATYLIINATSVINRGLIESSGTSGQTGVVIKGLVDGSGGGVILATDGSTLRIDATIAGGTLSTTGSGVIDMYSGTLDGRASGVHNTTDLMLNGNPGVTILGAIANTGTITVDSGVGLFSSITVGAGGATLTGGGQVDVTAGATLESAAVGDVLTNFNNTITGTGVVGGVGGGGSISLINDAKGVIDGQAGLRLGAGTGTITNDGLIEATGTLGLTLSTGVIDGSGGGKILATDGATVILAGADIVGGTFSTSGSGVIRSNFGTLDGTKAPVHNTGALNIDAHYSLGIQGTINNTGTIGVLGGGFYGAVLSIGAPGATLTGGGQVYLGGRGLIQSAAAGDTLTNFDNTISGSGLVGARSGGSLTLINGAKGVIDGNAGAALSLSSQSGTITNDGLIEATSAAGIVLSNGVVDGSGGGTILAANGGVVTLTSGGYVAGGTLSTAGSGVVVSFNGRLDGTHAPVHLTGALNISNHASLAIQGAIDNTGTITPLGGGFYDSFLSAVGAGATLTGGGQVVLGSRSYVYAAAGATLTNDGNTISGNGNFIYGPGGVVNMSGTIDDNGPSALTLPTVGGRFTNGGVLEATGTGGLIIQNATVNQSTGGQVFAGTGSTVSLRSVDDIGGAFNTAGTGVIVAADSGSELDGTASTVSNRGAFDIANGDTLTARGAIANSGTLSLASTGTATALVFDKNATLSGAGTLSLSANALNYVEGTKSGIVLTNVDNTITGSGQLGAGKLNLVNEAGGTIDAKAPPALVINTGKNTITNAGLLETTANGTCTIRSAVANSGTIEADGGTLTLDAAVSGSGAVTIAAGTLDIANANASENVAFTGKSGKLKLAQSQSYVGSVSGFSLTGKTTLDLADITYDNTTTESYSGTTSSGTLTVTHGAAVANIKLVGNYLASTFTLSSDGNGGTKVVDPPGAAASVVPVQAFIAAMAGLGAGAGMSVHTAEPWRATAAMLAGPRLSMA